MLIAHSRALRSDEKIIQKIKMKAYILEAAIATHSIIIGFEYGTLSPTDDLVQIKILYVAFVFHQVRKAPHEELIPVWNNFCSLSQQMFEGIGLGTVLSAAEKALGMSVVISLVLIFSTTFSIGILLGSSESSEIFSTLNRIL